MLCPHQTQRKSLGAFVSPFLSEARLGLKLRESVDLPLEHDQTVDQLSDRLSVQPIARGSWSGAHEGVDRVDQRMSVRVRLVDLTLGRSNRAIHGFGIAALVLEPPETGMHSRKLIDDVAGESKTFD
jgi:hypothetical protein